MAVKLYFLKNLGCEKCDAEEVTIDGRKYHVLVADYDVPRNTAEVPEKCKECLKCNNAGELLLNC